MTTLRRVNIFVDKPEKLSGNEYTLMELSF